MAKVELDQEQAPATPAPAPADGEGKPKPLVLDIVVDEVTIGDMAKLDAMASGESGSFAAGVAVLQRFVQGTDISALPIRQLGAISRAVLDEVSAVVNQGN